MRYFKFSNIALTLGILFLYLPLVVLVVFSFSGSPLISIWGGWSTIWYEVLFQDSDVIASVLLSLEIAVCASTGAVIIGTMAAYSLERIRKFRGKSIFYGMVVTPLVMPDVVVGISLLLMFISLQSLISWPDGRGFITILIAHITFCSAYVTVVMQSRLANIDTSIEEAAQDLGAKPMKTFFYITLPQIIPAIVSSWLLSFTLSLDDLVITEFVAGPSSTTLPMYIYSTVKTGPTPEINAVATIIIGVVSIAVVLATLITFRLEKRKKRERMKK